MNLPPLDTSPENLAYISALKPGERVVECGECATKGAKGTVFLSKDGGGVCVMWELPANKWQAACKMGTSVTWGTRRIADLVEEV